MDGWYNQECANQLQLLLHGLHCTLDGAYWQPGRASGRLTVCSDFCRSVELECSAIAGLTAGDIGDTYAEYCLNLAAHVGGSWGGGVPEPDVCDALMPAGSFETCGGRCVPRGSCDGVPCLPNSEGAVAAREGAVGLKGWEPRDAAGCAAWMAQNMLDPALCDDFNIYAWQTHYTRCAPAPPSGSPQPGRVLTVSYCGGWAGMGMRGSARSTPACSTRRINSA